MAKQSKTVNDKIAHGYDARASQAAERASNRAFVSTARNAFQMPTQHMRAAALHEHAAEHQGLRPVAGWSEKADKHRAAAEHHRTMAGVGAMPPPLKHPGHIERHPDHAHDGPTHMVKQHERAVLNALGAHAERKGVRGHTVELGGHHIPYAKPGSLKQGMHAKSQEARAERAARGPVSKGKMPQGVHPRSQEAHAMLHGAKGGTFYINEHGHKVYGKR